MSLVVFPFKEEDLAVVRANLTTAAGHHRVDEVWAVAASEGPDMASVEAMSKEIEPEVGVPVRVFAQDRIGRYRPGKGDGLNTALRDASQAGFDRVHFYDADITNFDTEWIESAEQIADRGYDIVRHRFPRAATDAMITWMVTRPSLAMFFPGSSLPRVGQPLGGEMLLSGRAVGRLAADDFVTQRSDWGIDTVLTYATVAMGLPFYEHLVASGKRHALYGPLDEIRAMMVECLDAVRSLRGLPTPDGGVDSDPPAPVPDDLKQTVGYDIARTVQLLTEDWSDGEVDLARNHPRADDVLRNVHRPWFDFMDAAVWGVTLRWLYEGFRLGDPDWEGLAFRLWLMRVLSYTDNQATEGYDEAIEYLEATIRQYEDEADHDNSP